MNNVGVDRRTTKKQGESEESKNTCNNERRHMNQTSDQECDANQNGADEDKVESSGTLFVQVGNTVVVLPDLVYLRIIHAKVRSAVLDHVITTYKVSTGSSA